MMQVSHNELVVLTGKAFTGLRRSCGEADMIANMVADLEMVGLNGIEHFVKALDFLQQERDCPVDVDATSAAQLTANLHGCSILCHLPTVLDFTLEKLIGRNNITLDIQQCHNRWLAFGELVKLAAKGLSVKASWHNGHAPKHVVYVLNKGCINPELFVSARPAKQPSCLHSLRIEISTQPIPLPSAAEFDHHISSQTLAETQAQAWQEGITVDEAHWQRIKQAAGAILVESSDTSRRGAGESEPSL
ncbi:DUF3726 domain-containing protein [Photobacterium proteolyticum]